MPDISVAHYMLSEVLQETFVFFIGDKLIKATLPRVVRSKTMYQMTYYFKKMD